jgi:hypothetical protein
LLQTWNWKAAAPVDEYVVTTIDIGAQIITMSSMQCLYVSKNWSLVHTIIFINNIKMHVTAKYKQQRKKNFAFTVA